ncbi:hypothetical protein CC2G_000444 [Coprinopsis cinerea AmutBmut pab1-1]|nr:hypothetical protein CC2G_000444 [Coprinopsis cinerea AmutBmut pab1-1]
MAPIPPNPNPSWPLPKFNLTIHDIDHEGVEVFLNAVRPKDVLRQAVLASYQWLYTEECPPQLIQELHLILRAMPGVAHATGSSTHKQIHFSLDYIKRIPKDRVAHEITGVLIHEAVHCFQFNAQGTCPGGLVEGIADFVRLKADYAPPHWKPHTTNREWDAGYDTTAYFLAWIESRYGEGTIRELNHCMKDRKYHRRMFKELTGRPVRKLWALYCASMNSGGGEGKEGNSEDEDEDEYDVIDSPQEPIVKSN